MLRISFSRINNHKCPRFHPMPSLHWIYDPMSLTSTVLKTSMRKANREPMPWSRLCRLFPPKAQLSSHQVEFSLRLSSPSALARSPPSESISKRRHRRKWSVYSWRLRKRPLWLQGGTLFRPIKTPKSSEVLRLSLKKRRERSCRHLFPPTRRWLTRYHRAK